MIGSKRISFSIPMNWLIAIAVVALALIAAFILCPQWRTVLLFVAPVLGGAAALIAAFNAIDARSSQTLQSKKAASLGFMQLWLDPPFFHAKKNGRTIIAHFREHSGIEEQKAYLGQDPAYLANLFDILNFFEAMSISIQTDIADEEILKRFFRSLTLEFWHCSETFIRARRAEKSNPRLLQEVEWLFNKWKT
jgi:Domain of unknown function (DUF4760)